MPHYSQMDKKSEGKKWDYTMKEHSSQQTSLFRLILQKYDKEIYLGIMFIKWECLPKLQLHQWFCISVSGGYLTQVTTENQQKPGNQGTWEPMSYFQETLGEIGDRNLRNLRNCSNY